MDRDLAPLIRALPRLHRWYRRSARSLPWRATPDPYAVWVSEVMLQQTRVDTVLPYYRRWMAAFPTVEALARAGDQDVLRVWEGLGYYARARNLHRAARVVTGRLGGRIPDDPEGFRALPGVGPYTAAAVLSIAFGRPLAVVDGNVRRVLCRVLTLEEDPRTPGAARALEAAAGAILPWDGPGLHNQAMMELGALVCTSKAPACGSCPVRDACRAHARGCPGAYPVRRPRRPVPHRDVAVGIVTRGSRVFIDRRPYGGLLGGLWEFPGGKVEAGEDARQALDRELWEEFRMRVRVVEALEPVRHAYSHLRVTLHPFLCRLVSMDPRAGEGREWKWVPWGALADHPMPRANRRILEALGPAPGAGRTA